MSSAYGYVPLIMVFDDLFLIREDLATEEIINKPWIEIQPKSNKVIYNGHVGNIGFLNIILIRINFQNIRKKSFLSRYPTTSSSR